MLFYAIGVLITLAIIWLIFTYNTLVKNRLKVENQWSQIDVQLKMRADLIPNLVETVKGYAKHENETLTQVIQARNAYLAAGTPQESMKATGELTNLLSRLMVLSENYPELKADKNFAHLQEQLSTIEKRIADYRQFYNDTVMLYNQSIQTFPNNLAATLFSFQKQNFWEIDSVDRNTPRVDFS